MREHEHVEIGSLPWAVDAADAELLAQFWAGTLGWQVVNRGNYGVSIGVEGSPFEIDFRFVPDGPKPAKNRLHLDVKPLNRDQQADLRSAARPWRATSPTSARGTRTGTSWAIEGNEFCLCVPDAARRSFLACDLGGGLARRPWSGKRLGPGRCRPSALIRVRPTAPTGSSGLILAMAVLRSRAGTACTATMVLRPAHHRTWPEPRTDTHAEPSSFVYASACPSRAGGVARSEIMPGRRAGAHAQDHWPVAGTPQTTRLLISARRPGRDRREHCALCGL